MPLHVNSLLAGMLTATQQAQPPTAVVSGMISQYMYIMLPATRPLWRSLTATLPKLQMSLAHTATPKIAMQRLISSTQGKCNCLALHFCSSGSYYAAAQQPNTCFVCRQI